MANIFGSLFVNDGRGVNVFGRNGYKTERGRYFVSVMSPNELNDEVLATQR